MRLFADRPDILTWGRWYRCPPGARLAPTSAFFARRNQLQDTDDRPLGELYKKRYRYSKRPADKRLTGQHFCGDASVWLNGINLADAPGLAVDVTGMPLCCQALPPPATRLNLQSPGPQALPGSVTFTTNGTWHFPKPVDLTIAVYGSGGAGGTGAGSVGGCGGGGGGYSSSTFSLSGGNTVTCEFDSTLVWGSLTSGIPSDATQGALAANGTAGIAGAPGTGGQASAGVGLVTFNGGDAQSNFGITNGTSGAGSATSAGDGNPGSPVFSVGPSPGVAGELGFSGSGDGLFVRGHGNATGIGNGGGGSFPGNVAGAASTGAVVLSWVER